MKNVPKSQSQLSKTKSDNQGEILGIIKQLYAYHDMVVLLRHYCSS